MNDRLKQAFDNVHAGEELKRNTGIYVEKELQQRAGRKVYPYRRMAAALACLVLLVSGIGGYHSYFTQISAISIDVNPSVELGINRFDKVISVEGYNDDGRALADSVKVRFLDYTDAVSRILTAKSMEVYRSQDSLVSITVVGENTAAQEKIIENVTDCTSSYGDIACSSGDYKEVSKAHEAGMSFGKYQAFLELQEQDSNVTIDEVKGLTMKQIREKMCAVTEEEDLEHMAAEKFAGSEKGKKHKENGHSAKGKGHGRENSPKRENNPKKENHNESDNRNRHRN